VIVAAEGLEAWDLANCNAAWRRLDLDVRGGNFDASGRTFFACLAGGGILEVDAETGAGMRRLGEDVQCGVGLSVSADGASLACYEPGRYCMIDRRTGRMRWAVGTSGIAFRTLFLNEGQRLLALNVRGGAGLTILDSMSGKILSAVPCEVQITGLAGVTAHGAYVMSHKELAEIDLASGNVLRVIQP
jgi:hypothetical protein